VPVSVEAGVDVVVQGEAGDLLYVIADGEVDVLFSGTRIATLSRGAAFGEIALMYDIPRTATVRTATAVHLYTLERDAFLEALTSSSTSFAALQRLTTRRIEEQAAVTAGAA
jgi:CRP-like cAMP-binding protein